MCPQRCLQHKDIVIDLQESGVINEPPLEGWRPKAAAADQTTSVPVFDVDASAILQHRQFCSR